MIGLALAIISAEAGKVFLNCMKNKVERCFDIVMKEAFMMEMKEK